MNNTRTSLKRDINRRVGFIFTALCCFSSATALQAAPQNGQIAAGSGNIQSSGSITQINQSSQQMIVDWDSFNVAPNESVNFLQPNSSAAVLNRIHDQNPSQIFGSINANGRVFLSNPNGMIFGVNSQVNVGSLFATTLDIDNDAFMARRYNFSAITEGGTIVSHGLLNAATGGSISLVADAVDNQGEIIAHYGYINLASGRTAAIDFDGDGFIHFEIDGDVLNNATGKTVGVNNSGVIRADGGEVLLTARNTEAVFERAINNDGLIEAGRMLNEGGVVRLVGMGGDVVHSGVIDVSGQDAISTGGEVQILGDRVGLFDAAVVDASGSSGGGTILVGGDFQGDNAAIHNASQTLVSRDSRITADALQSGNGGRVIIWADGFTRFLGSISAMGGADAGNGGFVEVSGQQQLGFGGQVDTSASNGEAGQLLLDPTNITINSTGGDSYADVDDFNDNTNCTDCAISVGALVAVGADVTLQATNDITFSNNLTLNSDFNLTVEARNDIVIGTNVAVTTTGTGSISLTADHDNIGGGNITMANGSELQTAGGNVILNGNVTTLETINAGTGDITVNATDINNGGSSSLTASVLTLTASAGGIGASGNAINTTVSTLNADTSMSSGDIHINETDAIILGTVNAGTGNITVNAADINAAGSSNLIATALTLTASAGGIGASGNTINTTADTLALSTGGAGAAGNIHIVNSAALNASQVTLNTTGGGTQTVNLTATELTLDGNFGNAADNLNLNSNTGIVGGGGTLSALTLGLIADNGSIGASGAAINTNVTTLNTNASANGGDIHINETDAIILGTVNAGTGNITVNAADINAVGSSSLIASALILTASAGGIGASGNAINTTADTLTLSTGGVDAAGDIHIVNSAALNASQVTLNTTGNGTQTVNLTATELTLDGNFGNAADNLNLNSNTGIVGGGGTLSALALGLIANNGSIGTSGAGINTNVTTLNANASANDGDIHINETGAIILETINAGSGNININATDINDAGSSSLSANVLTLTASAGGVGASGNEINTAVTSLNADTSVSGGDVYINEINAIALGTINAGSGNININAADINDAGSSSLTATALTVNASAGGIGAAGNAINTRLSGLLNATASDGDIYISDSGTLIVAQVKTNADVGLTAAGAIIDDETDNSGIDVIAGGLITLQSGNGIGQSITDSLNISADRLAITRSGGDVYITEENGVALAVIDAAGNSVDINVTGGGITDNSSLITAGNLSLAVSSGSSIGASGADINTDLSGALTVTATGAGSIFINETDTSAADGLNLAAINADSGNVSIVSAGNISGAGLLVTGNTLTIESTNGSVGSATESLSIAVTTLDVTAGTGIFIANNSDVRLSNISAGIGDIDILSSGTMTINTGGTLLSSVGSQRYKAPTINLYDSLSTTNSTIALSGNVVLFNPVSLDTNTGGGDVEIAGNVNSDDSSVDSLSISAGGGNIELLGGIGQTDSLYGLSATTSGSLLLNGSVTTNERDISLSASQINLADTSIWLSTGNGPGNITLSGNVDSVSVGSTQLSLQAGILGDVDLSNATVGSLIPFHSLSVEGNSLLLSDITTRFSQTYSGPTTISGDATFTVTRTDTNSTIRFLSSVTGSNTNNLSIIAPSDLGSVEIDEGINNVNNLFVSGGTVIFRFPRLISASDSINLALGHPSSILWLTAFGAENLSNNTALLSISTPGSINVDGVTISSALTLNAIGGSGSQIIFSADSTFKGSLIALADDGIAVNADITTTSGGADITLNSDANGIDETNDNILFSSADISSGGSLIMSATNGGIELAAGTTLLHVPNGGLDISGISVDGQSDPNATYILEIDANDDVRLGDIGQTNLIDSLSVITANNTVYLHGDISTRRSGGINLSTDIANVVLENDVVMNTTTGNGSVSLTALDGAFSLTVNSGNGGVSLAETGQTTALTALTVINQGTTALTGNITTNAAGGINFSGAQDVDITGDINLTANNAGSISLTGGTVDSDGNLVLASTGTTRVGGTINVNNTVDLSNASTVVVDNDLALISNTAILGGSISTAAGVNSLDLSGAGAITLSNDLLLDSSASDAAIDISGVDITGSGSLNVVSGTGDITLNNITDISSISVSGSGSTTLAGNLSTTGTGGVDLSGVANIRLASNVSIDTTTNSGRIDLTGGGIEGPNSLTLTTNDGAILLGDMGQNTALNALSITSTGVTTIDNAIISTQGSGINFTAATDINIIGDAVLNSSSGSGAINLDGGAIDGAGGLTVNVGRGDLFMGDMGQDVPLAYLTLNGNGLNQIAGNITTLGNVDFSAANIDSIDPAIDLLIDAGNGNVSLAEVGTTTPFLSLTVVTNGSVNLSNNITTQGAGVDFTGAGSMLLSDGADITIDTSLADDGAILLNNGLAIDGNGNLALVATLGDIELGSIGQTTAITSLTTTNTGTTTLSDAITSTGDISISSGSIAQNADITSTAGSLAVTAETDIVMDAVATSTTTGQPINYTSTTGDIYVAQINAGSGTVTLHAPLGNVYSSLGDNVNLALSQPNLTGSTATINSGGAIGRSSASGITIDASSRITLTFGADIAYINNVQGVPIHSSGRVIDVLADRKVMAAVGHSGGLEADAIAHKKDDFAILSEEQSLFLIAGPNNQFAAQYDDAEVISIINPDVPTLLHTKDAWIFQRPEEEDKQPGVRW